jgi:hypothetical protein
VLLARAQERRLEHLVRAGARAPRGRVKSQVMDTSTFCCGFRDFYAFDPNIRAMMAIGPRELVALSAYDVISGHFSLPNLLGLARASAIATVVREPRTLVVSQYAYWRLLSPTDRETYRSYRGIDHGRRPLDEYLVEPLVARATDNLICRTLLDGDARIPEVGFIAASDVAAVAQDAIGLLETLGYIGVLELGEPAREGLSDFFGRSCRVLRVPCPRLAGSRTKRNISSGCIAPGLPGFRDLRAGA